MATAWQPHLDGRDSTGHQPISLVSPRVQVQNDSKEQTPVPAKPKKYIILKVQNASFPQCYVGFVVQRPASYEAALQTAIEVFKVPRHLTSKLSLKCRIKGLSNENATWLNIQPTVWNDIVDDMEFVVAGFKTGSLDL